MNFEQPKPDREAFLRALKQWDRPEEDFRCKPLDADCDTDAIIDRLFSTPAGGFLKD
jgi:hypothetical protein